MTLDEFHEAVKELFEELNENDNYEFLLTTCNFDIENKVLETAIFSYGCAACVAIEVSKLLIAGDIEHSKKDSKKETKH